MSALTLPRAVQGRALTALCGDLVRLLRTDPVLIVDASRVEHLSDAGQALLVTAHRTARSRGGRLQLVQPLPAVVTALRASGLRHLLAADHAPLQRPGSGSAPPPAPSPRP